MRSVLETRRGSQVPEARLLDTCDSPVLEASCIDLPFREVRDSG